MTTFSIPPRTRRTTGWLALALAVALIPACSKSPTAPGGGGGAGGGGGGGGGSVAAEQALVERAFGSAFQGGTSAGDAVQLVAFAVFTASGANGGTPTATGTLTQNGSGYDYAAQPTDRLVVRANGYPEYTLVVDAFEGTTNGTWEDFARSHTNLAFDVSATGVGTLTIRSSSVSAGPASPTRQVNRTIEGTIMDGDVTLTVDLTHAGTVRSFVDGSYTEYETNDAISGTVDWQGGHVDVDEDAWFLLVADGSRDVQNMRRRCRSTGEVGGVSFAYRDVDVRSEHVNSRVNRPDYWYAVGTVERNGATFGNVRLESTPQSGTRGPVAILALAGGGSITLGGTLQ